jgi:hypothetical protein
MQHRSQAVALITLASLVVSACDASRPTGAPLKPNGQTASIEYSEGFYPDPEEAGKYIWDGQAVPGDMGPAQISMARAIAKAPEITDGGWKTSGFVGGSMSYGGDQYRMKVVYSVTENGQPVYSNSEYDTQWKWNQWVGGVSATDYLDLYMQNHCNIAVSAGGTAYAAKALPFRISFNLLKPKSPGIQLGAWRWGESSMAMQADSDGGVECTPNPCDDPYTITIEECDPNNPPSGPNPASVVGGSGDEDVSIYDEGERVWYRCWWEDHYWRGMFLYRKYTRCEWL